MKSGMFVVLGIVIGSVGTLLLASGILTGVGAGAGIITGLKAGACLTVEGAKEAGYITADQVDGVLIAAAQQIASNNAGEEVLLTGGGAECSRVVAELKSAAQQ